MGQNTPTGRLGSTCHPREYNIKSPVHTHQNRMGVTERKNRHLLEVTRNMMMSMNVPKYLWGQAVLTATYLINRMPSRVLNWKSPIEMLKGKNEDVLPLKTFGYVCFVQDNRPNVEKLDPKAVKCVFVGYLAIQKGYVCWSPIERRLFVSMDVTFRELEPYYSTQLASPFGDSLDTRGMRREGEDDSSIERRMMSVGDILCPLVESAVVPDHERTEPENGGTQAQGELRVYTRRRKQNEETAPTVPLVPSPLSLPPLTPETPTPSTSDSEYTGDMIPLSPPTLLSIRRTARSIIGVPSDRYGFSHNIAQFVSYSSISPVHGAFIAFLNIVSIPKCWQVAKDDPKWKAVMLKELEALDKNKTWELVLLPPGKKAVGCKWVFTVKQNLEGRVERYKARLVAK
jgi:Reverse transcriptase (RNA-dependent DNA polymerase)